MNRILLVEDTLTLAEEIADILRLENFEVSIADNGVRALKLLSDFRPDLVVTDLKMPVMDGFELITQIRKSDQFKSTPVLILSAKVSEADKESGISIGADAFLPKPCKIQDLLNMIRQLLGSKPAHSTL